MGSAKSSAGVTDTGWDQSAAAWLHTIGEGGDFGRVAVLDPVMSGLAAGFSGRALDVGCGEGRFVRMLKAQGFDACGIDPTAALIDAARTRDPEGDYHVAGGEALPFADASFDLVTSYLALCDIEHIDAALAETVRVLKPGGHFLFANLSSINTAGVWQKTLLGQAQHYAIDQYMDERVVRQRWNGIDIANWHRPFSFYMQRLLSLGLNLRHFDEPLTQGAYAGTKPKFDRMPNFVVMLWQKPA